MTRNPGNRRQPSRKPPKRPVQQRSKQREPLYRQSVSRHLALLIVALLCLGVACFLSFLVSRNHKLAFNPFDGQPQVKAAVIPAKPKLTVKLPQKTAVAVEKPENLSFYDILGQKNSEAMPEVEQYAIQIAAFQTEDRAQAYADSLKTEKRLNCRVDKTETLACVRWGTFNTKDSAEHYLKRIADTVGKDCMVVRM